MILLSTRGNRRSHSFTVPLNKYSVKPPLIPILFELFKKIQSYLQVHRKPILLLYIFICASDGARSPAYSMSNGIEIGPILLEFFKKKKFCMLHPGN